MGLQMNAVKKVQYAQKLVSCKETKITTLDWQRCLDHYIFIESNAAKKSLQIFLDMVMKIIKIEPSSIDL